MHFIRDGPLREFYKSFSKETVYTYIAGFPMSTRRGIDSFLSLINQFSKMALDMSRKSPKMIVYVPKIFGGIHRGQVITESRVEMAKASLKLGSSLVKSTRLAAMCENEACSF